MQPGSVKYAVGGQANIGTGSELQSNFGVDNFPYGLNDKYSNPYLYDQLAEMHRNGMLHSRDENIVFNLKINKLIATYESVEELLMLVQRHTYYFNEMNIAAIVHKIASLCKCHISKGKIRRDERFKLLLDIVIFRSSFPCRFSPKELSNLAWSLVKLGLNNHILFEIIGNESIVQMERFASINLSIILWSFAKAGRFNKNLFVYAIPKILSELDNLEPQQISNIAWSYSKVGLISPHLFENLKRQSIKTIEKFLPIHISMLCYAFSWADIVPTGLFEIISELDIKSFTPKALVHIFWSFSLAEFKFPISWIFWIQNTERISSLTLHELSLLITSFSLNFIKGFVLIKYLKLSDCGLISSNNVQKVSISRALAIRDKDPEDSRIEWGDSYSFLDFIQFNPGRDMNDYDAFIWNALDRLSLKLYETFNKLKEISDVIWLLTYIGKDTSIFMKKRPKSMLNGQEKVSTCQNFAIASNEHGFVTEDMYTTSNLCENISPFSTCCNSASSADKSGHKIASVSALKNLDCAPSFSNQELRTNESRTLADSAPIHTNTEPNNSSVQRTNSIPSIVVLIVYNILLVIVALFY
ncbi:transmembrane domain-containing or GPI anchor-containing protein [Cryptosporidium canis]|uniref:Transmembrane domain-containing or GPI anchor-containing protein n=1 Tax=Cryptosporidium canis TaxID=195482 RepID=A0A9D5DPU8_9CRYT|nr:transmembrane domain-containing or GPI anchor-containing protein [Cryptosporidium canis]